MDVLESRKMTTADISLALQNHASWFAPDVLEAALTQLDTCADETVHEVAVKDLSDSMVLMQDVYSSQEVLLVSRGWPATESVRKHLIKAVDANVIEETVLVTFKSSSPN